MSNAVEREMSVIRDAVTAEYDDVVALDQLTRIWCRHSLPRFAAVKRHVVTASCARPGRMSDLKRSGDHVVGVLRVDRDRNFGGIDGCRIGDTDHLLSEDYLGAK